MIKKQREKKGSGPLWRLGEFRLLLLVQVLFFIADGFLVVALLAFADSIGLEYFGGVLIFVFLIGAVSGSYVFGKKPAENLDHKKAIVSLFPGYIFFLSLIPLGLISFWFLFFILPLAGFARRGFTPSVQTLTHKIAPLKRLNEALAIIYVGLVLGSGLGRALISPIALNYIYLAAPAVFALLAFLAALLLKRK